jgi:hypothetical protein
MSRWARLIPLWPEVACSGNTRDIRTAVRAVTTAKKMKGACQLVTEAIRPLSTRPVMPPTTVAPM